MNSLRIGLVLLATAGAAVPTASGGQPARIRLLGIERGGSDTPILAAAPPAIAPGLYETVPNSGSSSRAVQVFESQGQRWLALILNKPQSQESLEISIRPAAGVATAPSFGVKLEEHSPSLRILIDGQPFTELVVGQGHKPFLYPLLGVGGIEYTRAYPMRQVAGEDHDHPHQRSLWFTHGKVNNVDFWSESKTAGSIRQVDLKTSTQGPVLAQFITRNEWVTPGGEVVCEDERTWTFYRLAKRRMLDLDVVVKATRQDVVFGDTKEGTFGIRVASSMDVNRKTGGLITNSAVQRNDQAWGKPAAWVDYTGPVAGQTAGIAVLNHPQSFRYPTPWHVRTYGLFAANPFGLHDFGSQTPGDHTIPKGQSIRLRYRVILHPGTASAESLERDFALYSHEPRVEIIPD